MTGDRNDMVARLKAALPARWFGEAAPVLEGVLAGIADIWTAIHDQLTAVIAQTRVATASDVFLDMIAADFFGARLPRRLEETDDAFRARIQKEMVRERGTRAAIVAVLEDLTGRAPEVFEPARPADTGAWSGHAAYGTAGRWGSLALPRQVFVTARRPLGEGIATIAGWTAAPGAWAGGSIAWGTRDAIAGQVTDADIAAAVAGVMPVATIAWLRIES